MFQVSAFGFRVEGFEFKFLGKDLGVVFIVVTAG